MPEKFDLLKSFKVQDRSFELGFKDFVCDFEAQRGKILQNYIIIRASPHP